MKAGGENKGDAEVCPRRGGLAGRTAARLRMGPALLSLLRWGRAKGGVVDGEPAPCQGAPGESGPLDTT